jgi:hypothetical protein
VPWLEKEAAASAWVWLVLSGEGTECSALSLSCVLRFIEERRGEERREES